MKRIGWTSVAVLSLILAACGGDSSSSGGVFSSGGSGGGGGGGGGGAGGGGGGGGNPQLPWTTNSYFPSWQNVAPTNVIVQSYNSNLTAQQNGTNLANAIAALNPGDMLRIAPGTYSVNIWWNIVLQGTAGAPIWIVADDMNNKPVITRPNNNQNVMNVGSGALTSYVCFRGLDITGGDTLVKLYSCQNLWIDQCVIHDGNGVGIAANSADTEYLYLTRNEIYNPGSPSDTSEGMYLGGNNSTVIMRYSIIALNNVHDTGGTQGDGIEVKQGSYNNWIVENIVHDCNYPCIIAYGTDGNGINMIERNILYNSNDNVMQVQGEAIIRNNLIMNGGKGFHSHDHQGQSVNLTFVHNTIINTGRGADLISWNNRQGMVFANNAVYSQSSESIRFPNGSTGVTISGNVVLGPVVGAPGGYGGGVGLSDFVNVSWNAVNRNATPSPGSPLIGAADPAHAVTEDLNGTTRQGPLCSGAVDAP